ncbi:FRG domain-containing protein [Neorhizobium galegae]|uniref:FRG domain-containing protein n=1 Tax=Neorhizobium galegae TaxID=399 RepID=UPI0006217E56|nr:FRG domain-containing protein [Neorhizobium galegae]KAB1125561.1 FRG domain-containing protein [Neorhizobium galegae]MCQ1805818.1 FRG domain-containing protein [Neorhizobium galegae]CDZ59623.1 FRG domain protein [Neorhizobium galegae bv. orientalis]
MVKTAVKKTSVKKTSVKKTTADNPVVSFLTKTFSRAPAAGIRCYRGQSDVGWELKPSVMRDLRPEAEAQIFSELMVEAPSDFRDDRRMFDKLVRAQHYSLPTRLLDVSLNPLVGLYFACNEVEHHGKDGVVQIFDFDSDRVKFADSDAVSLICNLARLSDDEKEEITRSYKATGVWTAAEKRTFRSGKAMKRLTQFVRVEKPYFLDLANPRDLFRYFFVYPEKTNRRVIAQSGAFIAAGLLKYLSPGSTSSRFTKDEILIKAADKPDVLKALDLLNINSRTMYPEIEFQAKYIKAKWTA